MRERLRDFYLTLDLRSLALFRVALALLLLQDAIALWPDIGAFFTDNGVLPADAPWPRAGGPFHYSVLDPLGTTAAVRVAFAAGMLSHLALLVGYRTRIAQVVSFVFFTSVVNRNPLLSHGAEAALTVLCLWGLFLPLGARGSLDARRARSRDPGVPPATRSAPSLAAIAYVIQIGLIYLSTAAAKTGPAWHEGTAVYYALHLDLFTTPAGLRVGESPLALLRVMSHVTYALEWAALALFLSPWAQPWLRRIGVVGLAAFHLGTAGTMALGAFPFIMCASFLPLVRPRDWDDMRRVLSRGRRRDTDAVPVAAALPEPEPTPALAPAATPDATRRASRWAPAALRGAVGAAALFLITCNLLEAYNASFARRLGTRALALPLVVRAPGLAFDLGRGWRMFAPEPLRRDGWWVVTGVTVDGATWDPLRGAAPDWNKPPRLWSRYGVYWRMYLFNISMPEAGTYQIYFARWLAGRDRPLPPSQRLRALDLWWVQEDTPAPGTPPPPLQRFRLWSWDAGADVIRRGDV